MSIIRKYQEKTSYSEGIKVMVPSIDDFRTLPVVAEERCEQFPKIGAVVSVGVMKHGEGISFAFDSDYICAQNGVVYRVGEYSVEMVGGEVEFEGERFEELIFSPLKGSAFDDPVGVFSLNDVLIGVDFHWQRHERQSFKGDLKFVCDGVHIHAINVIDVEAYLYSVISSEMSSTASLELLKAHAVISRSWLMAPVVNRGCGSVSSEQGGEVTKWYERDAHELFDVCADDHCQRYQGITRVRSERPLLAVLQTRGEVLMYDDKICDARYSKSCGGVSELFENCWADEHHDYLEAVSCCADGAVEVDLSVEANAQDWIRGAEFPSFCNTQDKAILAQVLNNFDQETRDFYRWRVEYSAEELSELVRLRSGIDFGVITDLIPVERGRSGRIVRLRIVGSLRSVIVGKELEIRKWLSASHLYSSAFVVDKSVLSSSSDSGVNFTLIGAGWGHGVGLCQMGAAVMGDKGYSYREILEHYFKGCLIVSN